MNTEFSTTEKTKSPSGSKKWLYSGIALLMLLPISAIITRIFIGSFVIVSGNSMFPTFKNGSLIFCTYVKYNTNIEVGDIVVFEYENKNLVKRVSAIPGDTVVENEKLPLGRKLENDEYYVLGDNSDNSMDSRSFGTIKRDEIKYKYYGLYIQDPILVAVIIASVIFVLYKLGRSVIPRINPEA